MDFHNSGSGGNILEHGEFVASEVIIEQLKTDIDSANVDEKLMPIWKPLRHKVLPLCSCATFGRLN
jgi:hypothetical protein